MKKIKRSYIIILLVFSFFDLNGQIKSTFPQETLDCIVLLEKMTDTGLIVHGTGFLLLGGSFDLPKNVVIVVTNEHVLRNPEIYVSFPMGNELLNVLDFLKIPNQPNSKVIQINEDIVLDISGNTLKYKHRLIKDSTFVINKDLDIAAFIVKSVGYIGSGDNKFVIAKTVGIPNTLIKKKSDIPLGTNVFFPGFPFGIGSNQGNLKLTPSPLVRKGSVAWISNEKNEFLLDAFSFSGNSGSPVFTTTEINEGPFLIGLVKGHYGPDYENFGLTICTWSDEILILVEKLQTIN